MRSTLVALGLGVAVALCACGDGDDSEQDRAERYSVGVERVTDDVSEQSTTAVKALNRVRGGLVAPRRSASLLDRVARRVDASKARLGQLSAPSAAAGSAGDLEREVGDLALHVRIAATDVRAAGRGLRDPRSVATSQSRLILADESGISALGRAVRDLSIESAR